MPTFLNLLRRGPSGVGDTSASWASCREQEEPLQSRSPQRQNKRIGPYKRRNVVERSFNTLKHWRSLATRYDKRALIYGSATVLHAVVIWSTLLGDTS